VLTKINNGNHNINLEKTMNALIKHLFITALCAPFSTLVLAEISLSNDEQITFARECNLQAGVGVDASRSAKAQNKNLTPNEVKGFWRRISAQNKNLTPEQVRQRWGLDVGSILPVYEAKVAYDITEFNIDDLDVFKYYPSKWIRSTSNGAYFETTILRNIRLEYKGDGWTLFDKTENIERAYTCVSLSTERGTTPRVKVMHFKAGQPLSNYFKAYDVHHSYYNTSDLEEELNGQKCKEDCGIIKSFITKYDK
jgi:hypothetical protein